MLWPNFNKGHFFRLKVCRFMGANWQSNCRSMFLFYMAARHKDAKARDQGRVPGMR